MEGCSYFEGCRMHSESTRSRSPVEEVTQSEEDSDASDLADELGSIDVHTTENNRLKVPVEKIDEPDDETVRLWYRFPTGELIPEDFEKPIGCWDETTNRLVRVVSYAGYSPDRFSELEVTNDAVILLEKTEVQLLDDELDRWAAAAPLVGTQFDEHAKADECLYFKKVEPYDSRYETWKSVDPLDIDEYDLFPDPEYMSKKPTSPRDYLLVFLFMFFLVLSVGLFMLLLLG